MKNEPNSQNRTPQSLPLPNPGTFFNHNMAVSRNAAHRIYSAARPAHRHTVGARRCAQAKMQTQIALRKVAAAAADFLYLSQSARLHFNTRANASPIRLGAYELYADPVVRRRPFRHEQRRLLVQLIHHYSQAAVIVQVRRGRAPAGM